MATKKQTSEPRFTGYDIIESKKYKRYADILCCILNDGETYTYDEIETILQSELNRVCE